MKAVQSVIVLLLLAALAACGEGWHKTGEVDQGGQPITRARDGRRVYDADTDPAKAVDASQHPDPFGIAPPRDVEALVMVPGPLVAKSVDELTPADRAWLENRQ